ncbi:hypothetical protein NUW54_g4221 [Trametes sanguinea]|uniref:Uncharacterized protein n=1 Tax=Trametes sanguinea TaxID=158606 RepID=A0ACC1PZM0_9APHY|nr:hypothetical protein NUW54_g4221 [Trametes sanguinea]
MGRKVCSYDTLYSVFATDATFPDYPQALETRRVRYRPVTPICLFMVIIGYGMFRTAVRWDLSLRAALNWTAPVLDPVHHSATVTVGSRVAGPDVIITPELSDITRRLMRQRNMAGLSLGIARLHYARHNDEFGSWGIMSEEGGNVTADTLFNIGSCSKAVPYLMGILMVDFRSGRNRTSLPPGVSELTWNTKVGDLLPEADWKLADEWATREANIGDALSHVTGVPRLAAGVRILVLFAHGLASRHPDMTLRGSMYILAAHIISQYAKMPYTTFATDRVFRPLEMSATTFSPTTAALTGNLSHAWSDAGRCLPYWLNTDVMDNMEMLAGPGRVASSARDMMKWMREVLPWASNIRPERLPHSNPAYDATTARAIVIGRAPVPGISMIAYGLGWMRMTYHGHELVYHSGAVPGFRTLAILLPMEGAGVVSLANSDDSLAVHEITAFNAVHGIIGLPLIGSGQIQNATRYEILPDWICRHLGAAGYLQVPQASSEISQGTVEQQLPLEMFVGTYSNVGYGAVEYSPLVEAAGPDVRDGDSVSSNLATKMAPTLVSQAPSARNCGCSPSRLAGKIEERGATGLSYRAPHVEGEESPRRWSVNIHSGTMSSLAHHLSCTSVGLELGLLRASISMPSRASGTSPVRAYPSFLAIPVRLEVVEALVSVVVVVVHAIHGRLGRGCTRAVVDRSPSPLVEPIFEALSYCASLHPDPHAEDEMDDDDDAFVDPGEFETFNGDHDQELSEVGRAALAHLESIIYNPFDKSESAEQFEDAPEGGSQQPAHKQDPAAEDGQKPKENGQSS